MKRILVIDGGGIKGVFPASFLAHIEESLPEKISEYFDLIVGTSTGGIIALALGMGLSVREILDFYEQRGPQIFYGITSNWAFWRWFRAKYDPSPLRSALKEVFGERKLGESTKRLIVPSFNIDTGEVHIWKTSHHPRFENDYKSQVVDVALSTAAAPTYFPTHRLHCGIPLVDGGVWANNPIVVALIEAMNILKWPAEELKVLSLGCTTTPLNINWKKLDSLGKPGWATKIADVFMAAQSSGAMGMAQILLPDSDSIFRISPLVGDRYSLDGCDKIPSLKGLGISEARKSLPALRPIFFNEPVTEEFRPFHSLKQTLL